MATEELGHKVKELTENIAGELENLKSNDKELRDSAHAMLHHYINETRDILNEIEEEL